MPDRSDRGTFIVLAPTAPTSFPQTHRENRRTRGDGGNVVAITDADRYQLHQRLEEILGTDEAGTLMEHLPPVGWADVATRRDLDHLGTGLRDEMRHLETRIDGRFSAFEARLFKDQRTYVLALLGSNSALLAVAFVLLRFSANS